MVKKQKWFHPRRESGWKKTMNPKTRRDMIYRASDRHLSQYERNIQAGRMIKSLANVTKDKETKKKADGDAKYFFNKAKVLELKGKRIVRTRKRVKSWG